MADILSRPQCVKMFIVINSETIDRVLTGKHNSNDTNLSVCTGSTINRYDVIIPSTDWFYFYVSALAPPCDHVGWLSAKPAGKWPAQYGSRHNDSSKNIWWMRATKWMDNQRSPAESYQWSIEVNTTDWPACHSRALCWVECFFANKKFASLGCLNYSQFTNEWCSVNIHVRCEWLQTLSFIAPSAFVRVLHYWNHMYVLGGDWKSAVAH